jgi:hypothetical protein
LEPVYRRAYPEARLTVMILLVVTLALDPWEHFQRPAAGRPDCC